MQGHKRSVSECVEYSHCGEHQQKIEIKTSAILGSSVARVTQGYYCKVYVCHTSEFKARNITGVGADLNIAHISHCSQGQNISL